MHKDILKFSAKVRLAEFYFEFSSHIFTLCCDGVVFSDYNAYKALICLKTVIFCGQYLIMQLIQNYQITNYVD